MLSCGAPNGTVVSHQIMMLRIHYDSLYIYIFIFFKLLQVNERSVPNLRYSIGKIEVFIHLDWGIFKAMKVGLASNKNGYVKPHCLVLLKG